MVFIIARPLPGIAGHIPSGSQFQRSHWAVIVCDEDWDADRISTLFSDLNADPQKRNDHLGFLFQLFRAGGGISGSLSSGLSCIPSLTTRDLVEAFPRCLITFVGMTSFKKEEILKKGMTNSLSSLCLILGFEIFNANPEYSLWSNNCQHWTQHLAEEITGQKNCPSTLSDFDFDF